RGNDTNGGIVDARPRQGIPEGAFAVGVLAGRRVAEGDVGVKGGVLEPGGGLDCRDDLAGHTELREAAERGLLVGSEVPNGFVQADQALLDKVLRVAAGEKVRARLQPHETGVAADQNVERGAVAVAGAE